MPCASSLRAVWPLVVVFVVGAFSLLRVRLVVESCGFTLPRVGQVPHFVLHSLSRFPALAAADSFRRRFTACSGLLLLPLTPLNRLAHRRLLARRRFGCFPSLGKVDIFASQRAGSR